VVVHAALGFTNKQIAYALGISNSTVRVLMARAAARIGVRTRNELLSHPSLQEIRPPTPSADADRTSSYSETQLS
jgi:DNA-binding NarL/FixJ family response regulator